MNPEVEQLKQRIAYLEQIIGKLKFPVDVETEEIIHRDIPRMMGNFVSGSPTTNGHLEVEVNGIKHKIMTAS